MHECRIVKIYDAFNISVQDGFDPCKSLSLTIINVRKFERRETSGELMRIDAVKNKGHLMLVMVWRLVPVSLRGTMFSRSRPYLPFHHPYMRGRKPLHQFHIPRFFLPL